MTFLRLLFNLPDGSIWANLIASVIWIIPSALYARLHVRKIHRKLDRIHKHLGIPHEHP